MDNCFYFVDRDYINFLKSVEIEHRGFTCVPNVQYGEKKDKFTYGAVLTINDMSYYVPVSSYSKPQEHLILIKDKKKSLVLGSLRFTYMIPIPKECCYKVNINDYTSAKSKAHVSAELKFCRRNRDKIERFALKTYNDVVSHKNAELMRYSCDFRLLERAYVEYSKSNGLKEKSISISTSNADEDNAQFEM